MLISASGPATHLPMMGSSATTSDLACGIRPFTLRGLWALILLLLHGSVTLSTKGLWIEDNFGSLLLLGCSALQVDVLTQLAGARCIAMLSGLAFRHIPALRAEPANFRKRKSSCCLRVVLYQRSADNEDGWACDRKGKRTRRNGERQWEQKHGKRQIIKKRHGKRKRGEKEKEKEKGRQEGRKESARKEWKTEIKKDGQKPKMKTHHTAQESMLQCTAA